MYKIHVFDKAFFVLATVAMITENLTFASFHINHCNKNKFFRHNHAIYESKLSLKNMESNRKCYSKKLLSRFIFYPIIRTQTQTMWSKCSKNYFLGFYHPFSYTHGGMICWTCLVLLKNPLDGKFGPPQRKYIK